MEYDKQILFNEIGQKGQEFAVKFCKTKAAYSAKPTKNIKLNFDKIRKEMKILVDTPIVLISEEEGEEIIIHSYGELVFKNCKDNEKISRISKKIYELGK